LLLVRRRSVYIYTSMLYALELHAIISGHVARRFGGVERRYAIRPGSLGIRSICFEASLIVP